MIRLAAILIGLGFTFVLVLTFGNGFYAWANEDAEETAEHAFHLEAEAPEGGYSFDGPLGNWDAAQLQRGYQVYKEVCAACHSLQYVAFRNLEELGYSEDQAKAEAATWMVPGINPETGENALRPGTRTDYFPRPFANDVAARAANNNAIPPDLSLMTKARENGSAYVYSLLTGYADPATHTNEAGDTLAAAFPDSMPGTGLHFNPYFANLNLAMAPPLTADGQVTYADGTDATVSQMATDVSAFLTWTAEPRLIERQKTGWWVLAFTLFATILAWFAKKQVWSAVKPKREDD